MLVLTTFDLDEYRLVYAAVPWASGLANSAMTADENHDRIDGFAHTVVASDRRVTERSDRQLRSSARRPAWCAKHAGNDGWEDEPLRGPSVVSAARLKRPTSSAELRGDLARESLLECLREGSLERR